MRKTRIHISVDGDGLIVEGAKGDNVDKSLEAICRKLTDACGVTFSGQIEGDADDEDGTLKVLFSEEISSEKGDEIDSLLSEINGSELTFIRIVESDEVARDAKEVYRLFNDYIRMENKIKGIPETAMAAWDRLGVSLGLK